MPLEAKIFVGFIGLIVSLAVVFAINPFVTVDPGEGAVVVRLGAIDRTLSQGTHLRMPFFESVALYDVQVQKDETTATAASADLQSVSAVIAVNYQIDASALADTYARIGRENQIKGKVIDPAVQEVVKASTAQYKADELITKRAEVTDAITISLAERLSPYNIVVRDVSVVNFDFSSSFNQAIEAKVTAQQQALKAENDLKRIEFEAKQTVEKARAEAESIRIQAQAINSQGGADYVQLKAIEKWNGSLPTQMVPGSAVPFLNLNN